MDWVCISFDHPGVVGWFIAFMFEGEAPSASLQPLPEYISKAQKFTATAGDKNEGLKRSKSPSLKEAKRRFSWMRSSHTKGFSTAMGFIRSRGISPLTPPC